MSKNRHLEKEKLEAEIARSLSVVKMKEAHKQIEDIEKLRKQASIRSISERVSLCHGTCTGFANAVIEAKKADPSLRSDVKIEDDAHSRRFINSVMTLYESIRFDLQKTLDIKKEDFEKLFPEIILDSSTYDSTTTDLACLNIQLADMKAYCLRSL